jgi:parvulin-like peptidyl-prolyl isomerase
MRRSSLLLCACALGLFLHRVGLSQPAPADEGQPVAAPDQPAAPTGSRQPEEAEVSILSRDMPLRKEFVYADGNEVVWTEDLVHLHGNAFVRHENVTVQADDVWADFSREVLRAAGNVRLTVDDEVTYAEELVFSVRTKKGIARGGAAYGAPWYYQGYEILRVSERESLITDGRLTTSSLQYPHTYFKASRIIVHLGKEIIAKHVLFMIGGVPLLYLPAYRRSIKEKRPAAVIVKVGSDSFQGNWASVILPLARRPRFRSAMQFDYSSTRGTGQGFETKYQIRDVRLREIRFDIPKEAPPDEKSALRQRASDVQDRLAGDFNRVRVQRLFLPFATTPADLERARGRAQEAHERAVAGEDFARLAQSFSDDAETRNREGVLGFLAEGDGVLEPALESAALALPVGGVSEVIQSPRGFYIFRVRDILALYGAVEKQVQMIFVAVRATAEAEKEAQELAQRLGRQARSGADFDDLIRTHGAAPSEATWTESEKRALRRVPSEARPDTRQATAPLNEFEYDQRRALSDLDVGDVADPISVVDGVLLLRLLDREPTPDFAALAREISDADSAERGGDMGYVGRSDVPLDVYRSAYALERAEVSNLIETPDAFYVVQAQQKRTMDGEVYIFTKDLFSYGRKETFRIGREWEARLAHRQDIPTKWHVSRRRGSRSLTFWGDLRYYNRTYRLDYGVDRAEMRGFGILQFRSYSDRTGSSVGVELRADKTWSLTEASGTVQYLPQLQASWAGALDTAPGFRAIHEKLSDMARKVEKWNLPLVAVPTFEKTTFTLRGTVANLFRDRFRYDDAVRRIRAQRGLAGGEFEDVYMRTADLGLDIAKESPVRIDRSRELKLTLSASGQSVWHSADQKGNRNIVRGVFSTSSGLSNYLFRVYNVGWIPGATRLKHELTTTAQFDWAPSANDREEDPDNPLPSTVKLYPFGSNAYLFEQKRVRFSANTGVLIKTRTNKVINALNMDASVSRDFTERRALDNRKWEFINSRLAFSPLATGDLYGSITATVDPNTYPADSPIRRDPFTLIGFSSAVHYRAGDYQKGWSADFGTQYIQYTRSGRRTVNGAFSWRPSTLFEILVDAQYEYDRFRIAAPTGWRANPLAQGLRLAYLHPYSQNITIRRNLRDWDLRISWRRYGSTGNVRKEFTYQINLIADPLITVGAGYDAVTESWGLRSLPIGVPATFAGGRLGRSGF